MNDRLHRDEELFAAALALPAAERPAYLERACAGDPGLRAAVEALLRAHETAGGFMAEPVVAPPPTAPVLEGPGDRIGRYKLLEKIGEGGAGVVYMAEQEEPVRRRVALKLIKLGMDTRAVIARFEAERQALALMEHPHIAQVFDAGATDTGRPFFVMELVRGVPITQFCDDHRLPPRARLELFVQVCHAIQHAHQKGVIHRDIKPTNILVTLHDGVAVPKVIDFGIAKATATRLTEKTLFTRFLAFLGTPAYTSPEQVEMSGLDVDTRSDVYSLGVLLYELLTGRLPFDARKLVESGLDAMRRTICEVEPPWPSTCLRTVDARTRTTIGQQRATDVARLVSLLRGDLDWIVMRCLEKDRVRRYGTANDLAADVQHFLRDEPVTAVAPSLFYTLRKAARRHRAVFVSAGAIVGVLIVAAVVATMLAVRATRAERVAAARLASEFAARAEAETQRQLAESRLQSAQAARAEAEAQRRLAEERSAAEQAARQEADRQRRLAEASLDAELAARAEAERQRGAAESAGSRAARAEQAAETEAAIVRAVSEFLRDDLLAQASPLAQPNRELRLRTVLDRAAVRIDGHFPGQPLVEAAVRETLATTYGSLGEYAAMQRHLERALALYEHEAGVDDPATLRVQGLLATARFQQGARAEGTALAEQTYARQEARLGAEHPDTLTTRVSLAVMRRSGAEPAEAERENRALLAVLDRVLGEQDDRTLTVRNNLARVLADLRRLAEAADLLLQSLAVSERKYGDEHPDTLATMLDLARVYALQDKLFEAEALYARTIAIQRRVLGSAHPDTLRSMNSYADVLYRQQKSAKADAVLREIAALRAVHAPAAP